MKDRYKQVVVLLVEDNDDEAELAIRELKKHNLANDLLRVIDGIEVLKEVRSDDRTKKIPVVVLTSSNEEKDIVNAYELGVNSYIVKPIDFQKFSSSIKDIGYYWLVLNKTV